MKNYNKFILVLPVFIILSNFSFAQDFPFNIGNKWYYESGYYNLRFDTIPLITGNTIKEIIDTTQQGYRVVSVTRIYDEDSTVSNLEYWLWNNGKYSFTDSSAFMYNFIIYNSAILSDTVWGWNPIWIVTVVADFLFNIPLNSQYLYYAAIGYQVAEVYFRSAPEIGLYYYSNYASWRPAPSKVVDSLIGAHIDGVDYGTILSVNNIEINESIFKSYQNYPNPFNPSTIIQYAISSRQFVTLKVYDILGREVASLVNEYRPAGKYETEFSAAKLSSGIYFYQLKAGEFISTKKMVLLK